MDYYKLLVNQYSKASAKQIIGKIHIAERELQPFIIPIYCEWNKDSLTLLGSGVLLKIDNNYILFTAAHVIDDAGKSNLAIPYENTLIGLDGFYCSPIPNGKTRKDDMYDFAFAFLDSSTVEGLLPRYKLLDLSNIHLAEIKTSVKIYSIIGFPGSQNKTAYRIKPAPYSYSNSALSELEMMKYNLNSNINIAISYKEKSTFSSTGQQQQFPSPKGISGGGIFSWKIEKKDGSGNFDVTPFLAGIFFGTKNQNKIWIGTKIQAVLQGVRNNSLNLKKIIPDYKTNNLDLVFKQNGS